MTLREHLRLAFFLLAWGCAQLASAKTADPPRDDLFGLYAPGADHFIGINRFVNDAGETVVLFADYQSGVVRRLFPESALDFVMGPASAERDPVEMHVRFTSAGDTITGLEMRPVHGAPAEARRVPLRHEAVNFTSADARLSGTLISPGTQGPHPAIVLLHGSGPLTRHSFGPYPHFFASLGFAVLIFDKRGTGESTGTRFDASTGASAPIPDSYYPTLLVDDAQAAFRFLRERPGIDAGRVGFWGSSEGGMLTTQVAAREPGVAFAINSSGFVGPLWETLLYQAGEIPRSSGATAAQARAAHDFAALWIHVARTGKRFDTFVARREEARRKDVMLSYFSGVYETVEQMRWDWEHILSFDSRPALARVRCPVLGLFGGLDPLTDARVAVPRMREGLALGGNRDFTARIFPDGSHSLTELPAKARMAPGLFDTLRSWLRQRIPSLQAPAAGSLSPAAGPSRAR